MDYTQRNYGIQELYRPANEPVEIEWVSMNLLSQLGILITTT